MIKPTKEQSQKIPSFITKLYKILQDDEVSEHVHWAQSNSSFMISDTCLFTDVVMPKYFKHKNFCSFIRQLNMYGFHKVNNFEGDSVYEHPYFQKNHKEQLYMIQRKISQKKQEKLSAEHFYVQKLQMNFEGVSISQERQRKNPNAYKMITYVQGNQIQKNEYNSHEKFARKIRGKDIQTTRQQQIDQNNKLLKQNNQLLQQIESPSKKQKNNKLQQTLVYLTMLHGNNQLFLPNRWGNQLINFQPQDGQEQQKIIHEDLNSKQQQFQEEIDQQQQQQYQQENDIVETKNILKSNKNIPMQKWLENLSRLMNNEN